MRKGISLTSLKNNIIVKTGAVSIVRGLEVNKSLMKNKMANLINFMP
jgi:hypothetical protein